MFPLSKSPQVAPPALIAHSLNDYFNIINLMLLVLDTNGTVVDVNQYACELLGAAKSDLLGQNWCDRFIPADHQGEVSAILRKAITDSSPEFKHHQNPIVTKSGVTRIIRWRYTTLHDTSGKVSGIIASGDDVTQDLETKQLVKDKQRKLTLAMDLANLVQWELDLITNTFTFNDQFYALYNTTAEAVGGYSMPAKSYAEKMVHPDDRHLVADEIARALSAAEDQFSRQISHRIIWPNGTVRHITVRYTVIKDQHGKPVKIYGANQDITDQKQFEAKLKSSEERLRILFEYAPDASYLYAKDGTLIDGNKACETLFGYDRDELRGKSLYELNILVGSSRAKAAANIAKMVLGQPSGINQYRIRQKDGTQLDIETHAFPIKLEGKTVFLGTARDITSRLQAQMELKKFKRGIEQSGEVVFITDKSGQFEYVNPQFTLLYGYSPEEVLGKTPRIIKSGQTSPEGYRQYWGKLLNKETVSGEIVNKTKEGKLITVETRANAIVDNNDNVVGFIAMHRDRTDQKNIEAQLRQLSRAVEQSPNSVVITDLQGTITYVNPRFTQMSGYPESEAIGQNPRILKSGTMPAHIYTHLWQTITAGKEWHGELQNKRKDGSFYWVDMVVSPIKNEAGQTTHFLALKEDITEKKRMSEESVKRAWELERMNTLMIGRELKMMELKQEIKDLKAKL